MSNFRVAYLSSFPPKICGIGSYTRDLIAAMNRLTPRITSRVIVLQSSKEDYNYGPEVVCKIQSDNPDSFIRAATFLNQADFNVISLQHEYGLYGGEMGDYIIKLLERLKVPVVTALHMVSVNPTAHQIFVTQKIVEKSQIVAVMTHRGKKDLIKIYKVDEKKIKVIPHGAQDISCKNPNLIKKKLGLAGKRVLLSVNILRSSQGVDLVIKALPAVLKKFPNLIYVVIGPDPPGEKNKNPYRVELEKLINQLGLKKHVLFINRYLPLDKVTEYIQASDIFLTPYRLPEESSSGSLAYAVVAGKVCISTPFGYAKEVLGNGRGRIVPWENSQAIAEEIINLFSQPKIMEKISRLTYLYGRKMLWFEVAKKYQKVFLEAAPK